MNGNQNFDRWMDGQRDGTTDGDYPSAQSELNP